jgi:hypothetical protein
MTTISGQTSLQSRKVSITLTSGLALLERESSELRSVDGTVLVAGTSAGSSLELLLECGSSELRSVDDTVLLADTLAGFSLALLLELRLE